MKNIITALIMLLVGCNTQPQTNFDDQEFITAKRIIDVTYTLFKSKNNYTLIIKNTGSKYINIDSLIIRNDDQKTIKHSTNRRSRLDLSYDESLKITIPITQLNSLYHFKNTMIDYNDDSLTITFIKHRIDLDSPPTTTDGLPVEMYMDIRDKINKNKQ